jgi:hypothetical protein
VSRWWPSIRAALILLACMIGVIDGCPVPPHDQTRKYAPEWAPTILEIDRFRLGLLKPVRPIADLTLIRQKWSLFSGASLRRFQMRLEGKPRDGQWKTLFRAGDDDVAMYADMLHYRRIRGVWNPSGQRLRGGYDRFCKWMNTRVLADHPEFDQSRVVLERIQIGADGGYTPTGELLHERLLDRRSIR